MPAPILSICIPTYNRKSNLIALIQSILLSKSNEFEVVVSDNASSDGTLADLRNIQDKRLHCLAQSSNQGSFNNIVTVLSAGHGDYSMLLLDKDNIDIYFLDDFIASLQSLRPASGLCRHGMVSNTPHILHHNVVDAINAVAYQCQHPSGYFFSSSMLRRINFQQCFSGGGAYGHFFLDVVHAEMAKLGAALEYRNPLIIPENLENGAKLKSFSTNAAVDTPFYYPSERQRVAILFTSHLSMLGLPHATSRIVTHMLFKRGLLQATIGYASAVRNPSVTSHYRDKVRTVGLYGIVWAALSYIFGYLSLTQATRKHSSMPSSISLVFMLTLSMLSQARLRIARSFSI